MDGEQEQTGYHRATVTAHWIKTKPTNKDGERIPLEQYIKYVFKAKGWTYRLPAKKITN